AAAPALRATATTFAADLTDLAGRAVPVTTDRPRPHDIVLRLDPTVTPAAEGYTIAAGGSLVVSAATDAGAFWGTRTVLQLLHQHPTVPAGTAHDWPDYPYRGVALCNCVKYFSVPWLERLIRDMSYLKYNVLHLEMRIESTVHPENNSTTVPVYSPAQVTELAAFGARYHVLVSQQDPSPGHMDYYLAAHPELQARDATGTPNAANLDMADPSALGYVRSIIAEQQPLLPGPQWYGGGDEYLATAALYENYPSLVAWAHQLAGPDAPAADSYLLWQNQVAAYQESRGRTLHLWNDQLFTGMPTRLDPKVVVDYWIRFDGRLTPAQIVANGNDIVNVSDAMYFTNDTPPDPSWIYQTFTPNLFSGGQTIPADDPHLQGAAIALWPGAHGQSEVAEEQKLFAPLRALAQKNWGGTPLVAAYTDFQPVMDAVGHAPGYLRPGIVPGGSVYQLRDAGDGSYATVTGATAARGSVVTGAASAGAAGRWLLSVDGYGQYTLVSAADGRCATVADDSYADGGTIVTTPCDSASADQKWLLERSGDGFVLRSDSSGRVLTSPGGTPGASLVQRYGTGAAEQRWQLVPAADQVTSTLATGGAVTGAGTTTTVTAVVTNHGTRAVSTVDVTLAVPGGFTATAAGTTGVRMLAPGGSATVRWRLAVPEQVVTGFYQVHASASYRGEPYRGARATGTGATATLMATDASVRDAVAYTADFTSATVTPIALATGTAQPRIGVGSLPGTILAGPGGARLYVANQGGASVTVIDTASRGVVATVPVGTTPAGLVLSPDGKTLWVTDYSDNAVQPIDVATLAVGAEIPVGAGPENLVISPDGTTLWVACRTANEVVPVDVASRTAGAPVAVGNGPNGIAITRDGRTVYIGQEWGDTVTPVDTATRTAGPAVTVGSSPFDLTTSPDGSTVAVALQNDRELVLLDTATGTVRQRVLVGPSPSQVVFSGSGNLAYAAIASNNTVVPVILPSGQTGPPIPVGGYPIGLAIAK
ncbi:MAG TPA: family 20 glycosylhydrolase, partial [Rugosimonospora sp.]|nr:family 20 glycosylhydrolase [Rugosimonospora sp.]